jgi:ubiquinone/menaquinone biosynthesis C-methylase UbiE
MRKNESINYELLYNQVGKLIGWDFSNLKVDSFGKKWDFYEEVVKRSKKTDVLLDIGTGGGEKVLRIASSVFFLIGIDKSPEMIKTANKNLAKTYLNNVRFFQMDAKKIIFPDRFFNITSCRQAMFFPEELSRVLCDNGVFITQQVSEADKINIKDVFGSKRWHSQKAVCQRTKANRIF